MSAYKVIAKAEDGKTVTKVMEAENQLLLNDFLRREKLIPMSVKEVEKAGKGMTFFKTGKIRLDDLGSLTRQLATMLDAGIPLLQGLKVIIQQAESSKVKAVFEMILREVESGKSFSEALNKHQDVFSEMYISMVRAGEESGKLEGVLDRLAIYLEKTSALVKKVKSALMYPIIVICVAFGITVFLLVRVIPIFKEIFASFDAQLPPATAFLIQFSDGLRKYFLLEIGVCVGLFFCFQNYLKTPFGRRQWDQFKLRMPLFGSIFKQVAVSKFTRTFSTLVKSGVPILISLEIVGKTAGNKVIENAVLEVKKSIREGEHIAEPLEKSKIFPPMVVRMIAVGEMSGKLESMLTKIADFYDEQVDSTVKGLTSIIEPVIITFMGIVVGGIVVTMYLPIFKLSTIVSK